MVRSYRPPTKPLHRRGYEYHLTNVPTAFARTLAGGYDVAHAFFLADAWAAVQAHAVGGPPVVYSFIGIPTREWPASARLPAADGHEGRDEARPRSPCSARRRPRTSAVCCCATRWWCRAR